MDVVDVVVSHRVHFAIGEFHVCAGSFVCGCGFPLYKCDFEQFYGFDISVVSIGGLILFKGD